MAAGYVIQLLSLASNGVPFERQTYVRDGDENYLPPGALLGDKCGLIYRTNELNEAMIFPTAAAAIEWMSTTSTLMPLRPDGKPNRPFTAYNAEFVPIRFEVEA